MEMEDSVRQRQSTSPYKFGPNIGKTVGEAIETEGVRIVEAPKFSLNGDQESSLFNKQDPNSPEARTSVILFSPTYNFKNSSPKVEGPQWPPGPHGLHALFIHPNGEYCISSVDPSYRASSYVEDLAILNGRKREKRADRSNVPIDVMFVHDPESLVTLTLTASEKLRPRTSGDSKAMQNVSRAAQLQYMYSGSFPAEFAELGARGKKVGDNSPSSEALTTLDHNG